MDHAVRGAETGSVHQYDALAARNHVRVLRHIVDRVCQFQSDFRRDVAGIHIANLHGFDGNHILQFRNGGKHKAKTVRHRHSRNEAVFSWYKPSLFLPLRKQRDIGAEESRGQAYARRVRDPAGQAKAFVRHQYIGHADS